mgnify:FL=1
MAKRKRYPKWMYVPKNVEKAFTRYCAELTTVRPPIRQLFCIMVAIQTLKDNDDWLGDS